MIKAKYLKQNEWITDIDATDLGWKHDHFNKIDCECISNGEGYHKVNQIPVSAIMS
jgi:hypothetical protein